MIPIQLIFVRPVSEKTAAYNINDSPDTHSLSYEDIYLFMSKLVSRSLLSRIKTHLDRKEVILIDVPNDKVSVFSIDYKEMEEIERRKMSKVDHDGNFKENKETIIYDNELSSIYKSLRSKQQWKPES